MMIILTHGVHEKPLDRHFLSGAIAVGLRKKWMIKMHGTRTWFERWADIKCKKCLFKLKLCCLVCSLQPSATAPVMCRNAKPNSESLVILLWHFVQGMAEDQMSSAVAVSAWTVEERTQNENAKSDDKWGWMKITINWNCLCQKPEVPLGLLKCCICDQCAWVEHVSLKRSHSLWHNWTGMRWEYWYLLSTVWPITDFLAKSKECLKWQRLGEAITLLMCCLDIFDDDWVLRLLRFKSMVLDSPWF